MLKGFDRVHVLRTMPDNPGTNPSPLRQRNLCQMKLK